MFGRRPPGSGNPPVLGLGGHARVGTTSRRGANLLSIDGPSLVLRCLSTYRFAPHEVVAIERDGPAWLGAGVRIVHNRADYPREINFRCAGGADAVAALLAQGSFVPSGSGPAGKPSLLSAARLMFIGAALLGVVSALVQLFHQMTG